MRILLGVLATFAGVVTVALTGCGGSTTTVIEQQQPGPTQTVTTSTPGTTTYGTPRTTTSASADCGEITFSGTPTTIVPLRGVDCSEAVRVATAFAASTAPLPWQCGLAHEPLDSYPLPDGSSGVIGFSCGYGSGGDMRAAPHSFLGVAPHP